VNRLWSWPRQSLVCEQAVELVTDYLEGTLSSAQRRRFETHLKRCPDCPEYLAQIRAIAALAGRITSDDLTPHMRSELISLYHQWRAEEEGDRGPGRTGGAGHP
jgi:anti-sigma factor RsiW